MQLHLFQTDIRWEKPEKNKDWLLAEVGELKPNPGDILILPEMYATGFSMNVGKTVEPKHEGEPNIEFLHYLANSTGCCVVGGVATQSDTHYHNEAIATFPDGKNQRYQKYQLFTAGGESKVFTAGEDLLNFQWQQWCVGLSICYDLRFPEIYRSLALNGAELIVNIANWPRRRINHWVQLLAARAIENQCYIAGVNRVGEDPENHYTGRSIVVDPHGKIIADAGSEPGIASVTVDLDAVHSWRSEFPALKDMRHQTTLRVRKQS